MFLQGTYQDFVAFCGRYLRKRSEDQLSSGQLDSVDIATDRYVLDHCGELLSSCELAIQESMEIYPCYNCMRLVARSMTKVISSSDKLYKRPEVQRVMKHYEDYNNYSTGGSEVQLCSACWSCFRDGKVSEYSFLNDMWPDMSPEELLCLNPYELQSISGAKCCQKMVKLFPYKYKGPTGLLTRAVRGLSLHLPLPTGTISSVSSIIEQKDVVLPDLSSFIIHVDSLPKLDKNIIFRSMYDLQWAKRALRCLKLHNHLYHNITINEGVVNVPEIRFTCDDMPVELIDDACTHGALAKDSSGSSREPQLLPSKRKLKVNEISFFDQSEHQPLLDSTEQLTGVGLVNSDSESQHCGVDRSLLPGGRAATKLVKAMNYKIPYAIPYKEFLAKELQNKSSLYIRLPNADVLEEYTVIDMDASLPKKADLELFAMKPLLPNPLKLTDPYIDVACFPQLYPYGTGGIFHRRTRIVPVAYFIEHRFRMSDPRFRRCLPYLFDCALRKDQMSINSSLFTMLISKAAKNITAGQIKKGAENPKENFDLERNVSTMMRRVCGTPQYWQRVRLDLEAYIEDFGKPTFFVTFSCAEYHQSDYRTFLEQRNADLPNVQRTSIRNLVALDPVCVASHFERRFSAFFSTVILDKKGPLGEVEHHFIRKEYQQSGAPHMHVLLWVKDAPVHGKDSDDDVTTFVQQHVTCSLPDPIESPVLYQLVSKFQIHSCSKSCLRQKKVKGKFYCSYCPYGFPRKITNQCLLNSLEDVLKARAGGKERIKLYSLRRKPAEMMINDYNPVLLSCWGSNVDIQYVMDDAGCLSHYITKYLTKSEKHSASSLAQSVNKELSQGGQLKSLACKFLSSRQMGSFEAADKVLRHPMYRLSREVKTAGFYYPGTERRRLKPLKVIGELQDNSTDIFCNNFQDVFYPRRPKALEELSPYEVLKRYEYRYGIPVRDKSLCIPELGVYFAKRSAECVVRLWKTYGEGREHLEHYAFQVVSLFRPWRKLEDLRQDFDGTVYSSYTEVYNAIREKLPSLQRHESHKARVEKMIEWAEGIQLQVQKEQEEQQAQCMDILQVDPVQQIDLELTEQSRKIRAELSQQLVDDSICNLNAGQRAAFDIVTNRGGGNDGPRRVFVSGVGGTGKSFLIRALRQYFEFHFSTAIGPSVLVAAPTGVAAANVDGVTVHRLLKLPVSKGNEKGQLYFPLHPADSKMLRILFASVKLLVIDEVSMLSNLFLLFVHKRLNEILIDENVDPGARFGNINVLLLGDLLQLPPVSAPHVFQYVHSRQIERSFRSMGTGFNLWDLFEFVELTTNMRQRDDLVFSEMLERIRVGCPTADDLTALRSRLIVSNEQSETMEFVSLVDMAVDRYIELLKKNRPCLCIMPLNEDVTHFNATVMTKLGFSVVNSKAVDVADTGVVKSRASTSRKKSATGSMSSAKKVLTTSQTGGLEESLTLAVGARVMLRRNIDVKLKLINGTIGIIECIDREVNTGSPEVAYVRFDDVASLIPVKKVKSKYYVSGSLYIERCQFPLTIAYAITVHKCQGLSLESAMIDLGRRTFGPGMAYVALSRVVKLENVHLLRFVGSKVVCDAACVEEYNRLRRSIGRFSDVVECNKNPEIANRAVLTEYPMDDIGSMLCSEKELRSLTASVQFGNQHVPDVAAKKRSAESDVPPIGQYLKLSNSDAHSCFANAVLQCLLNCSNLYPVLQQCSRESDLAACLTFYFDLRLAGETRIVSVENVRSAFGTESQYSVASARDCDPAEFVSDILSYLPIEASQLLSHEKAVSGYCPKPACGRHNVIQDSTVQLMEYGFQVDPGRYSFADVFKTQSTIVHRCRLCGVMSDNFPVSSEYSFTVSCKYLVLNNPIMFGTLGLVGKPLANLVDRSVRLYGQSWRLIGCVQMKSSTAPKGRNLSAQIMGVSIARHYVAYVRHSGRQWVRLDDAEQRLLRSRPRLVNMVLLFLERTT